MMTFFTWLKRLFKKNESEAATPAPVREVPPMPVAPKRPADLPAGNHYGSRSRSLMVAEYEYLWPLVQVGNDFILEATRVARWSLDNKATFGAAAAVLNIPWWVLAGINNLEMGTNFNGTILNGDPWKEKTRHYPSGLGPWKSWTDACVWGMRHEAKGWNFDLAKYQWTVGNTFYFAESYNGHNARLDMGKEIDPPHASPYLYSGTQFYRSGKLTEVESPPGSGKYVGKFRKDLVSKQVGFMAFAKVLQKSGEKLF